MQYVKRVYILYVLINSYVLIGFDYSGIVPVYCRHYLGANEREREQFNMKTITRKQAREAIQSKGIGSAIGVGKLQGVTAKQRKFAESIVMDGLNASDAYRAAYDTSAKSNTINVNASKLLHSTKVSNTIDALERAKEASASHSAESLRALCVSTLVDVACNSDRDAVRVAAVRVLGSVVGVDAYRETKRIETVKDSDDIKAQIMLQLKTMMLGNADAETVDASDLLAELTIQEDDDPTVPPPCHSDNGTPTIIEHTIPLEQSEEFLDSEDFLNELEQPILSSEPTPMSLESSPTPGDIFLEDEDSYQDVTVSSYSKQMTTK
jgi:hypothetical protein